MTAKTYRNRKRFQRRGASAAEACLVLLFFLILALGTIDGGIMVARQQSLSQAARSAARAAIVRGEHASVLGSLGPTGISGTASDTNPIAAAARPQLSVMDPGDVTLETTWPDGNNHVGSRVRVSLSAPFTPILTFIFGSPTWTLTGSSEMTIAH